MAARFFILAAMPSRHLPRNPACCRRRESSRREKRGIPESILGVQSRFFHARRSDAPRRIAVNYRFRRGSPHETTDIFGQAYRSWFQAVRAAGKSTIAQTLDVIASAACLTSQAAHPGMASIRERPANRLIRRVEARWGVAWRRAPCL